MGSAGEGQFLVLKGPVGCLRPAPRGVLGAFGGSSPRRRSPPERWTGATGLQTRAKGPCLAVERISRVGFGRPSAWGGPWPSHMLGGARGPGSVVRVGVKGRGRRAGGARLGGVAGHVLGYRPEKYRNLLPMDGAGCGSREGFARRWELRAEDKDADQRPAAPLPWGTEYGGKICRWTRASPAFQLIPLRSRLASSLSSR